MITQHISSKPLHSSIVTEGKVSSLDNALLRNSYMSYSTDKVLVRDEYAHKLFTFGLLMTNMMKRQIISWQRSTTYNF